MKNRKFILITGHRKSGTSVFHKLFDGHPELNVYPVDISLLYAYLPQIRRYNTDRCRTRRFYLVLEKSLRELDGQYLLHTRKKFKVAEFLELVKINSTEGVPKTLKAIITLLSNTWIEYGGLNPDLPFLFKETSQIFRFKELEEAFGSNFTVVNLVRDPRDNFAAIAAGSESYYSKFGETRLNSLASVVNRVKFDFRLSLMLAKSYPYRLKNVKFEDLTDNTKFVMEATARFLNIKFDESLLEPTKLGVSYEGNSHDGLKFSGISSNNIGRWRDRISADEARIIEFMLEEEMSHFGYRCVVENDDIAPISDFYNWYNQEYFFNDSFENKDKI